MSRAFFQTHGVSIPQYVRRVRVEKALELLAVSRDPVGLIGVQVGYYSMAAFCRAFLVEKGVSPKTLRKSLSQGTGTASRA